MAVTENELQEKRQKVADLQRQINEEKAKRVEVVRATEREAAAAVLDAEIAKLEAQLDAERVAREHQENAARPATDEEAFNAGAGVAQAEETTAEVTPPPAPPAPAKGAGKADTTKEN